MRLTESLTLPLPPDAVARMYADPAYAEVRREVLQAQEASSRTDGDPAADFGVTTSLVMPTDRVPDMMRRFVGSSVTVREVQRWGAPEGDGTRHGSIRFEVVGAPATMEGDLRLEPQGSRSSRLSIVGDLVARVPLLGRRIEQAALPYASEVLRLEERSAERYAAARR